jgi:3-phenylpropionate/cinnamic acid dioxygenase small subunit
VDGNPVTDASIEDEIAVGRLLTRFNFAMDMGDPKDWAACYTPDGRFRIENPEPVVVEGRDALVEFCVKTQSSYRIRHHSTNVAVSVTDEGLYSTSYMTLVDVDNGNAIILTGVIHDRLRRHEGAWLIAERRLVPDAPVVIRE